jgi:hypothetical protein
MFYSRNCSEQLAHLFIKRHPEQITQCKRSLSLHYNLCARKVAFMIPASRHHPKHYSAHCTSYKSGFSNQMCCSCFKRQKLTPTDKLVSFSVCKSLDLGLGDLSLLDGHQASFCPHCLTDIPETARMKKSLCTPAKLAKLTSQ